jgi:hypothetical protein
MGYRLDGWGSIPIRGNSFLFSTVSRPALGPTQSPIQWVLEVLSLGIKQPGHEADLSPLSSAEVKIVRATLPFPHSSSWRGA